MTNHTHEEFVAFLDEAIKPGKDLLCCVLNKFNDCSLCKHPLCIEHQGVSTYYCDRCRSWLLHEF